LLCEVVAISNSSSNQDNITLLTIEDLNEKIDAYLAAQVPIVWIFDPYRRTVTVHRPGTEPELFNVGNELSAEPQLPGFRVLVARLFE
jgi:Uma2 family endonuclease